MVMKYPISKAVPKTRPDTRPPRAPFRPAPKGWPVRTIPKRIPVPRVPPAIGIGGRLITRAIPYVGLAVTAYELYDWWQNQPGSWNRRFGWVMTGKRNPPYGGQGHVDLWNDRNGYDAKCVGVSTQFYTGVAGGNPAPSNDWWQAWNDTNAAAHTTHRGLVNESWQRMVVTNSAQNWLRPAYVPNIISPQPLEIPKPGPEELPILRPRPYPDAPMPYQRPQPGEQPSNKPAPTSVHVPPMPVPAYVTAISPLFPQPFTQVITVKPGGRGGGPGGGGIAADDDFVIRPPFIDLTPPAGTSTAPPITWPTTGRPGPGTIDYTSYQSTASDVANRSPRKGEKERKVRSRAVGRLWAFVGSITEGMDLIQVLYDALPEGKCGKFNWKDRSGDYFTDPYEKAVAIYNCFEHIDVGAAIEGYINNQIEDFMYSLQGKAIAKASNKLNVTTGLSRAITQNQGDDWIVQFVPKLDIDFDTGEIEITVGKPAKPKKE